MMKTLILSAPPLLAALTVAAFLPAATARAGLIVRMDFNDADGEATLVNAGSEPVTATLHNVTLEPVSPPVNRSGYSARFSQPVYSGTNYVSLGDINALDGLTQLTIAAWVKEEESKGSIRMISKGSAAWGPAALRQYARGLHRIGDPSFDPSPRPPLEIPRHDV